MSAFDLGTENAVLGSMLAFPAIAAKGATIDATALFSPLNAGVLIAAQKIHSEGRAVNFLSVSEELEVRGKLEAFGGTLVVQALTECSITNSPANFKTWLGSLAEKAADRASGEASLGRVVDAYYDSAKREFVMRNDRGRWLSHPSQQFAMLLITSGLAKSAKEVAAIKMQTINTRDVHFTGSLAGHRPGFYEANGVRFLVTEGPNIITPIAGDWSTIRRLVLNLLGADPHHGEKQVTTFFYWMRSGFESVANGQWRPSQILALAGPVGCGKSLLQRLITEVLGGRAADAFRYLNGGTEFNREMFGAEHLFIDDAQASTDKRTRLKMAAQLKSLAVGRDHQCHGKGRDALNLRPLWRCSISLNDEGECLLVLPPLRSDIADKIHVLKCSSPPEPFPTETPDAQALYWSKLVGELPAFLEAIATAAAPVGSEDARFGIKAFHHPALVAELESQSPEIILLEMIDAELWRDPCKVRWEGTAHELEATLLDTTSNVRDQVKRLLQWEFACGTYLGRLATKQPDRVANSRASSGRRWTIAKAKPMTA